jgi:hypothetical protein
MHGSEQGASAHNSFSGFHERPSIGSTSICDVCLSLRRELKNGKMTHASNGEGIPNK